MCHSFNVHYVCSVILQQYAHVMMFRVLTSAIDYIQYLKDQKKKQEDGLEALRKEVMALKIMKA